MKGNPAAPGGPLPSKPTWRNAFPGVPPRRLFLSRWPSRTEDGVDESPRRGGRNVRRKEPRGRASRTRSV